MKRFLSVLTMMLLLLPAKAQESDLSRHNFLYAGQSKQLRLFKVENGRVSWMHHATNWRGEFSDAILMTDGHILLAHQYGIAEINQEHQVLWSYAAPPGTEIHTIQPIGQHHVVFVQNGHPAMVRIMEIPSLRIVHEFEIPDFQRSTRTVPQCAIVFARDTAGMPYEPRLCGRIQCTGQRTLPMGDAWSLVGNRTG